MIIESKIIAVDFDGTIVDNKYPKIGKAKPFAFETLKMLQADGHRLILWTVRVGTELSEAVDFCKKHGLEFYAVNENFENEGKTRARKINADLFVDDRNVGGFPGWGEIYEMISGTIPDRPPKKKKWLF
ncbi:MAG: hydrolase [Cyclobacteriaceae bacterium]